MARGTWQGGGTWQTSGGGGGLVLVIAAAVLLGSGAASAIASALVTILIVLGCTVALAAAAAVVWVIWRLRREARPVPILSKARGQLGLQPAPEIRQDMADLSRPAIGPGREVHLHLNVTPDELAAIIMRHYAGED